MDLNDPVWFEEPVLDSWEYLCTHEIPRSATPPNQPPPQSIPATPSQQPDQGVPVTPSPQPDQVEMPPDYELMDLNIPEDIPDLLHIPEEVMSEFDVWTQDMLSYHW